MASRIERLVRRGQEISYAADSDWELRLHRMLGSPWPCPEQAEFSRVWQQIAETMASHGLRPGRGTFLGHDDADAGLARALWCLVVHLRPDQVVETGVAHGVSSRTVLEALERNGHGHLSSIDLPPLTVPERWNEIGAAVPADRRARWTYVQGSSRRKLPELLGRLGGIQLFIHDSWHSTRNTRWELESAWSALAPGGALVVDDMDHNWALELFSACVTGRETLHCTASDELRLFGIVHKQRP